MTQSFENSQAKYRRSDAKSNGLKRPLPLQTTLAGRALKMKELGCLLPENPQVSPFGFVLGNRKIGKTGTKFQTVFVWNIPPVISCPGASPACLQFCYNGDNRPEVFPISSWSQNLAWFLYDKQFLSARLCSQLQQAYRPCAVRIHSAGDFFSSDYVDFWTRLAALNSDVRFWAYTRSWVVPELQQSLADLRALANVQIFASWDETMADPPREWRLSCTTTDPGCDNTIRFHSKLVSCPEQSNRAENCASCGFCMKNSRNGVIFTLH